MTAPADPAPATERTAGDLAFSAIAFVIALLPRLYVALAWAREPVWDGHYYDFGARRIAEGHGYSDDLLVNGAARWHPWCHYPVGYSGFLAGVYRVFGDGPHVAPVANAAAGALLVVAVHRASLLFLPLARARVAALLTALSPELVVYAALLMTEPLAALGPVVAVWLAARERDRRPLLGAAAAGIALGLATLVRPQTVLGAPALALVFFDPTRCKKTLARGLATGAIATATCLLVVAPWTARNCRVMDGCAFVSTNAGWNLAIGSFPRATGRFETLRSEDGCRDVTGQVQQDRCWGEVGLGYILHEPWRWAKLIPAKLSHTFDYASFPMGYLGKADAARFPEERQETGRGVLTVAFRALLIAAAFVAVVRRAPGRAGRFAQGALGGLLTALALATCLRDDHPAWWLALATPVCAVLPLPGRPPLGPVLRYLIFTYAAVVATHAVFFGEDRYHVVLEPVLAILAAAALPRAEGRLRAGDAAGPPTRRYSRAPDSFDDEGSGAARPAPGPS